MKTALALVALLVLLSLSCASACSCMMPGTPTEEMENSDAVFAGKVTQIEMPAMEGGEGAATVTLDVSRVWKGVKSKTITVSTATNSAACGFFCESSDCTAGFKRGSEYVVYASDYGGNGILSTSICTRTKLLSEAQEDLQGLGEGTIMEALPNPPQTVSKGSDTTMVYALIAVIAAALISLILIRKKYTCKYNG